MTVSELVRLIHAADKKHKGCKVELTAILDTTTVRGTPYGIITLGRKEYQRVFHDEAELRDILERAAS